MDILRLESLAIRGLADSPQRGADTFPSPHTNVGDKMVLTLDYLLMNDERRAYDK